MVKRPTEKPGVILTRVPVPSEKIFLPVTFQCRLSYGVRTAPAFDRMHMRASTKSQTRLDTGTYDTLIGMGSAALDAAVFHLHG